MLSGAPPHYSMNRHQILQDIVSKKVMMRPIFSPEAKNFLEGLLERNPKRRLGTLDGAKAIKAHPWFSKINWKALEDKKIVPPFKPDVYGEDDTRNIDRIFLQETVT